MPRNLTKMTPSQRAEHRAYLARKKRESRERKRAAGLCPNCGVGIPEDGYVTCRDCIRANVEQERAAGWRKKPSKVIPQTIRRLRREGRTVNDILKDPYLMEYEVKRQEVTAVLDEAHLL